MSRAARLLSSALAVLALACATATRPGGVATSPPAPAAAAVLDGLPAAADWVAHLERELAPFWTHPAALGSAAGEFPTFRCHDGRAWDPAAPCPELAEAPEWIRGALGREYTRMRARQTYFYGAAFHLTGDERFLELALAGAAGLRGLVGPDGSVPSWTESGVPQASIAERTSQDLAYAGLGLAMVWYLTRDEATLDALLRIHRHLMDAYWREDWGMLAWTREGPEAGRQELVAQLDPVNAYLLLVAPLLPEPRRGEWMADLRRLAGVLVERYWNEELGMFWGRLDDPAERRLGGRHMDFGHTVKGLWMLERVAVATGDEALAAWARPRASRLLDRALVAETGCWADAPREDGTIARGLTWWSFAELDQAAATLALGEPARAGVLPATARCWRERLVDGEHGGVWSWADPEDASRHWGKAHLWKSGYHEAEHALVLAIAAAALHGEPAVVHFALPVETSGMGGGAPRGVTPYFFRGRVLERRTLAPSRAIAGHAVERVAFVGLR